MNSTTPLKVAGYIRVSTAKQDIGPEVQQSALEAEAARNGWELTLHTEQAASAASLKNRPVLEQLLEDLKRGIYQALAVSKLDRLSRNVADFAGMLQTSSKQGWALVSLDLGIDTSTITGAAMAQVTCTFAEMERKKIAERTKDGMARIKATTGKHMGRRSVLPAEVVERINKLRGQGQSYAAIANELNSDGVPTATGKTWHPSTIRAVITRVTQ